MIKPKFNKATKVVVTTSTEKDSLELKPEVKITTTQVIITGVSTESGNIGE